MYMYIGAGTCPLDLWKCIYLFFVELLVGVPMRALYRKLRDKQTYIHTGRQTDTYTDRGREIGRGGGRGRKGMREAIKGGEEGRQGCRKARRQEGRKVGR